VRATPPSKCYEALGQLGQDEPALGWRLSHCFIGQMSLGICTVPHLHSTSRLFYISHPIQSNAPTCSLLSNARTCSLPSLLPSHKCLVTNLPLSLVERCLLQEYLAHKKPRPPRTLQYNYTQGPMVALRGVLFLMSEVPLHLVTNVSSHKCWGRHPPPTNLALHLAHRVTSLIRNRPPPS